MIAQWLIVALLVFVSLLYSTWRLLPVRSRLRLVERLLPAQTRLKWPARLRTRLQAEAQSTCGSCRKPGN
jgi:type VI protein secretion system component VasK